MESRSLQFHSTWIVGEGQLSRWNEIVNYTKNVEVFKAVVHEFLSKFPWKLPLNQAKELLRSGDKGVGNLPVNWKEEYTSQMFYTGTPVSLVPNRYYYPDKPNFPVIDSFIFIKDTPAWKAQLICFQITRNKKHSPNTSSLNQLFTQFTTGFTFLKDDMEKSTCLGLHEGKPCIKLDGVKDPLPVEVHIIFITSESDFRYQELRDDDDDSQTSADARQFWKQVKQYRCGPPTV